MGHEDKTQILLEILDQVLTSYWTSSPKKNIQLLNANISYIDSLQTKWGFKYLQAGVLVEEILGFKVYNNCPTELHK